MTQHDEQETLSQVSQRGVPNAEYLLQSGLLLGFSGENSGGSARLWAPYFQQNGVTAGSGASESWERHPCQRSCAATTVPCWELKSKTPALKRPVRLSFGRGSGNLTEQGESWRAGQGEHSSSVGAHNGVPVAAATREDIVHGPECACAPRAEPLAANEFKIHHQGRGQVAISAR